MILHWRSFWKSSLIFILCAANSPIFAAQAPWPFDQRQIALAHKQGTDFPDDRTVAQIMDAFVRLGRVKWVTQKAGAAQVSPVDVPADFAWQSAPSVRQLGLRYTADGILTLSQKGVQLVLEWYSTVDGQPLFFETVSLPEANNPTDVEARKKRLISWVEEIWAKIPGVGYVTKRDMSTATVEGADQVGLKEGDQLEFRRLEKLERHPLLKTVVGISSSSTGKGTVKEISKTFATATVDYESQVDPIQVGDRYLIAAKKVDKVEAKPTGAPGPKKIEKKTDVNGRSFIPLFGDDDTEEPEAPPKPGNPEDEPKYKVLDLTGFLAIGKVRHTQTSSDSATARSISAFAPDFGIKLLGYVTREVVIFADLSFALVNFRKVPSDYNVNSLSSGLTSVRIAPGYRFLFNPTRPSDGEVVLSLGYRRLALSLAQAPVDFAPSAKSYSGFDLGLLLRMPVSDNIGIHVSGARILSAKLNETPAATGGSPGSQVWSFELGGNYILNASHEIYFALMFDTATTTFSGTSTRAIPALSTSMLSTMLAGGYKIKF